jgi:hypothetical protein
MQRTWVVSMQVYALNVFVPDDATHYAPTSSIA